MLSIWLAGLPPSANQNALKELLDALRMIGRKDVAERIRKRIRDGEFQHNSAKTTDGVSKKALSNKLSNLMTDEVGEGKNQLKLLINYLIYFFFLFKGIKLGQNIVRIVANIVGLKTDRSRRCECFPNSNASCSYCSIF